MRRAFFWFGGTTVLLAIGYATVVATNPQLVHWSIILLLALLIIVGIGFIVTGIMWAIQSYQNKYKKNENKPSSIEQKKSLQAQNPLSVGEFLDFVHAHKCSKCGWGIKVDVFNKVATCPKCGNVDNVDDGEEPQLVIEDVRRENYGNVAGFVWGLVVKNEGIDGAEECTGELVAIDFADKTGMSLKAWPLNQPLQWGNIPEYSSDTISIGGGKRAVLQIINRDFVNRDFQRGALRMNAQHICYSRSYEFRETHYLPVSNYPGGNNYLIVIAIASKGKLPIYAVCYLKSREKDDYCKMKLIEVMAEEPNLEEYRQRSVARIAEIEKQLTSEWYHEIGMDYHDC